MTSGDGRFPIQNAPNQITTITKDIAIAEPLKRREVSGAEYRAPIPFWNETEVERKLQFSSIMNLIANPVHASGVTRPDL